MKLPALFILAAALIVTAPRLVLAFLDLDGLSLVAPWPTRLLTATAIGTAITLTAGQGYLAHQIVTLRRQNAPETGVLGLMWIATLAGGAFLTSVEIRCAVHQLALGELLTPGGVHAYSLAAVLSPELIAAGCLLASAASVSQEHGRQDLEAQLEAVALERNEAQAQIQQLENGREPPPVQTVQTPCRNDCGWVSKPLPPNSAASAERGHQRSCPRRSK